MFLELPVYIIFETEIYIKIFEIGHISLIYPRSMVLTFRDSLIGISLHLHCKSIGRTFSNALMKFGSHQVGNPRNIYTSPPATTLYVYRMWRYSRAFPGVTVTRCYLLLYPLALGHDLNYIARLMPIALFCKFGVCARGLGISRAKLPLYSVHEPMWRLE